MRKVMAWVRVSMGESGSLSRNWAEAWSKWGEAMGEAPVVMRPRGVRWHEGECKRGGRQGDGERQ